MTTIESKLCSCNDGQHCAACSAPGAAQAIASELRTLMSELQSVVQDIAHDADPALLQMRRRIETAISSAKRALLDGQQRVERQARSALACGNDYVRQNPWKTAGGVALAGVVVGVAIAKLRR